MSKTIRNYVRYKHDRSCRKEFAQGDDAQLENQKAHSGKKRMSAYKPLNSYKFTWKNHFNRPTPRTKLIVKNANRSLKKAVRQQAKRLIREELL